MTKVDHVAMQNRYLARLITIFCALL